MTVAIIGAGVMGETLLSGLIRGGRDVAQLMVGEKRPERAAELVCAIHGRHTEDQLVRLASGEQVCPDCYKEIVHA